MHWRRSIPSPFASRPETVTYRANATILAPSSREERRKLVPQTCLALLICVFALWALLVLAAVFATRAVVRALVGAVRSVAQSRRRRRAVDAWLLWGGAPRPSSTFFGWRSRELTSARLRLAFAHSLRRIEGEVRGEGLPGRVPLNETALRSQLGLVGALEERLEDRSRPVSVHGMVLVDRLLTEQRSPFYSPVSDDVLAKAMSGILAALDPLPLAAAA
jgi:hypothetical protein